MLKRNAKAGSSKGPLPPPETAAEIASQLPVRERKNEQNRAQRELGLFCFVLISLTSKRLFPNFQLKRKKNKKKTTKKKKHIGISPDIGLKKKKKHKKDKKNPF